MRISDWSSDVCSSDLIESGVTGQGKAAPSSKPHHHKARLSLDRSAESRQGRPDTGGRRPARGPLPFFTPTAGAEPLRRIGRPPGGCVHISRTRAMAQPTTVQFKRVSNADPGSFHVHNQHPHTMPEKITVNRKTD